MLSDIWILYPNLHSIIDEGKKKVFEIVMLGNDNCNVIALPNSIEPDRFMDNLINSVIL